MIGIPDPGIWLAYGLAIGSAVLCVVYGIINWNKGGEEDPPQEIAKWVAEEKSEVEDAV
jgi:hypothetical protein